LPSAYLDFKIIKRAASMQAVLAHYNITLRRVNQSYLRGTCPLPTHTSAKSANTFGVSTTKNVWACQSQSCVAARQGRKGGNVLDFVAIMEGENCSIRDAALKLQAWFNLPSGQSPPTGNNVEPSASKQPVAERKTEGEVTNVILEDAQNKPLGFALKNVDHLHPYLTARKITPETAAHFGAGFFSGRGTMHSKVVVPIRREGKVLAYAGRSIDGSEPRWKLPNGFRKSLELFHLDEAIVSGSDCCVLVEGFFACMWVYQCGYPSVVALMGSSLSAEQEELLLKNFSRLILMLDGNTAGREATEKIAGRLMRRMFVKMVELPDEAQPDTLSTEQIQSMLGSI
jgi:DNA primase